MQTGNKKAKRAEKAKISCKGCLKTFKPRSFGNTYCSSLCRENNSPVYQKSGGRIKVSTDKGPIRDEAFYGTASLRKLMKAFEHEFRHYELPCFFTVKFYE